MSGLASPDFLLESRGVQQALSEYVVAATFDRTGAAAAFALAKLIG